MRALLLAATLGIGIVEAGFPQSRSDTAAVGRLRQEDVAVRLTAGNLSVRVVPVYEPIIALLTAEAGEALRAVEVEHAESIHAAAARRGTEAPSLMLVTVFATGDGVPFDPELLTVESRNRLFRPMEIVPLSPLWRQRRLPQRETLSALYLFEEGIAFFEPMVVEYDGVRSEDWARRIPRIEAERARLGGHP